MYKAESKRVQTQDRSAVRQRKGTAVESAQSEQTASLEALAESSPQVTRQAQMAEMIDASPTMAAQRQRMDTNQNSPRATAQLKLTESIHRSPAMVAQRKEEESAPKQNNTGLPDNLKSGIENLSGMSLDSVKVHYNSPQPAQLNAHAYAQGTDIHVAPGQEQHLPHEAWHVVQQAQGRVQPTTQMKEGVPVNDNPSLEEEADVMGEKAIQREAVAQLTPEDDAAQEEKDAWMVADHVHGNMPLDAGHITGGLLKRAYLRGQYEDVAKRKRISELATQKLHLIDKNMYGRGKIGAVMRAIDTTSRIMHLIGSISGLIALAANIAAFFAPAALPVGAIAGVIALAAHSAMVVCQTILIGRNLYRIRGLPEAEKAKILPTLYRDIAKLCFGIIGVVTGGVGLGSAMQGGGLMASHALEGAEATAHGLHLGGDIVGDTVGTYAMGGTIAYQNEKEMQIGMAGGLDHHAKHGKQDKHEAPAAESQPDDMVEVMRADIVESTAAVDGMSSASQDALGGADGLKTDIKPLEDLSAAEPKAQQALASLDASEASLPGKPDMQDAEIDAQNAQVAKAEETLGVAKSEEEGQKDAGKVGTAQKASTETTQRQATVQRDEKPGLLSRAASWLKRKFSSFKKRVKKVIQGIQAKLTELVLKLAGVKNLPAQMDEALVEQRAEAAQVTEAANAGRGAIAEWKSAADQIGKKK